MGWLHAKMGKGQASPVFAFEWSRISSRTTALAARRRRRPTRRGQSPASLSLRVETQRDDGFAGDLHCRAPCGGSNHSRRRASHAKTGAAWASPSARASRKAAIATARNLIRGSPAFAHSHRRGQRLPVQVHQRFAGKAGVAVPAADPKSDWDALLAAPAEYDLLALS
jgi:hypothetical protein